MADFLIKTRTETEKKDGDSLSLACGASVYGGFCTIQNIRNAPTMSDVTIGAVAEFLMGSPQLVKMVNTKGEPQPLIWELAPGKNVSATLAHRIVEPAKIVEAFRDRLEGYTEALEYLEYWETCKEQSEEPFTFDKYQAEKAIDLAK